MKQSYSIGIFSLLRTKHPWARVKRNSKFCPVAYYSIELKFILPGRPSQPTPGQGGEVGHTNEKAPKTFIHFFPQVL